MESIVEHSGKNDPIIFIIGSTASGKTKLSLALATSLKEIEIVNADALQLYKGADIMTAKATPEEKASVNHHLLDILPLEKMDFGRKDYFHLASTKIKELQQQGKIPLVVGGTNYYIESLLYNDFDLNENINEDNQEIEEFHLEVTKKIKKNPEEESPKDKDKTVQVPKNWQDLPLKDKHDLLARIDPLIAEKIHPNDAKRVNNYIEVYLEEGILPSKKIIKMNSQRKLRYPNLLVFWVKDKDKTKLGERIKKRIHEMVNMDGIREIISIYSYLEEKGSFDFTKGVLQSIGYKEFYDFYKRLKDISNVAGSPGSVDYLGNIKDFQEFDKETQEVLDRCIRQLIVATEHYAKRQLTWIKNRIFRNPILQNRMFLLEFSDSSKFEEEVIKNGLVIMNDYLAGKLRSVEFEGQDQDKVMQKYEDWKRNYCEICDVTVNGQQQWELHLKSRKHKKIKEGLAKHKHNMEMKEKYGKKKPDGNQETDSNQPS